MNIFNSTETKTLSFTLPSVRPSVRPSITSYFRTTMMAVFEGFKLHKIVIINNGAKSDDELVASDEPCDTCSRTDNARTTLLLNGKGKKDREKSLYIDFSQCKFSPLVSPPHQSICLFFLLLILPLLLFLVSVAAAVRRLRSLLPSYAVVLRLRLKLLSHASTHGHTLPYTQ